MAGGSEVAPGAQGGRVVAGGLAESFGLKWWSLGVNWLSYGEEDGDASGGEADG